jgi:ankyrin repeat protein
VQDQFGRTILHWAAEQNAPYALAALLNKTPPSVQDINGETPLTLALKAINEKAVLMLQETRQFDVDTVDSDGDTPLHNACLHANQYTIKTILNTHININSPNNNAETPIHVAFKLNNDTAVQMLREQNAVLNVVDYNMRTPLITAAYYNCTEAAIKLFQDSTTGCDPYRFLQEDQMMAENNFIFMQNSINARDNDGNTALHYCSMHQNTELAKFLVKHGENTTILNNKEETAASILLNQENVMTSEIYVNVFQPL